MEESRNVVKTALGRLQLENHNAKCELGEEQFRLEIPERLERQIDQRKHYLQLLWWLVEWLWHGVLLEQHILSIPA